jgi:hypothetical protein
MISTVAAACEALLREPGFNDFWVVSALPDCSYEEGVRNSKFRRALGLYRDAEMEPELLDCAALGINGNLQKILERPQFDLGEVRRNQGKGQDLILDNARVEVKLLFDGTFRSYYDVVARDWEKLGKVRASGHAGQLFLIVFFVQLPHRTYAGAARQAVHAGIEAQYGFLQTVLPLRPDWPPGGPQVHPLDVPEGRVREALERRFDLTAGEPGWFEIEAQLAGAGVGACIWEYPQS